MPPLWLLWHRLWIEALLAFAASIALATLGEQAGLGLPASALSLLVSLYVGLEGQALRAAALRRRGWREWGVRRRRQCRPRPRSVIAADGRGRLATPAPLPRIARLPIVGRPSPAGPALGLLGYPGRT